MAKAKSENIVFCGTGRRKSSIARVRLTEGTGKITINGKDIEEYLGLETLKVIVKQPLTVTNTLTKYDIIFQYSLLNKHRRHYFCSSMLLSIICLFLY